MSTLEHLRHLATVKMWDREQFQITTFAIDQSEIQKVLAVVEAADKAWVAYDNWEPEYIKKRMSELETALAKLEEKL